jgi:hypothetical protein
LSQARDPVAHRITRRQHQNRRPDSGLPEPPADLQAVDAGEHQVADDRVVLDGLGFPQAFLSVAGNVDGHSLPLESAPDKPGHFRFLLDDQDTHKPPESGFRGKMKEG